MLPYVTMCAFNHLKLFFQLKRKAKELQRTQAKQYQLEQELAFMKLDAKFQPLDVRRD